MNNSADITRQEFPEMSMMWQLQRVLEVTRKHFEIDVAAEQPSLRSGVRLSGARMVPVRVARRRGLPDGLNRAIQSR